MHDDRRTHQRIKISVSAEVTVGDEVVTARVKNLSIGGIGLDLDRPLAQKTSVKLNLFLVEEGVEDATEGSLDIQAEVIWVSQVKDKRWEAGLRFAPQRADQTTRLGHFIRRVSQGQESGTPPPPPPLP